MFFDRFWRWYDRVMPRVALFLMGVGVAVVLARIAATLAG